MINIDIGFSEFLISQVAQVLIITWVAWKLSARQTIKEIIKFIKSDKSKEMVNQLVLKIAEDTTFHQILETVIEEGGKSVMSRIQGWFGNKKKGAMSAMDALEAESNPVAHKMKEILGRDERFSPLLEVVDVMQSLPQQASKAEGAQKTGVVTHG